jgi:hypothetical protein
MRKSQVRGLFFESLVKKLLYNSGYTSITDGKIQGRGEKHQIDAYGKFSFHVPFVFPIRLLAEAKWYSTNVKLQHVRNFVGVVKDISENYFVKPRTNVNELNELLEKRYTDCGAIFSATSFSIQAQRYAYAQCIYLIPYNNNSILKDILNDVNVIINYNLDRFSIKNIYYEDSQDIIKYKNLVDDLLNSDLRLSNNLQGIGSYLGILDGIYPVHILSDKKIQFNTEKPDEYKLNINKDMMYLEDDCIRIIFNDEYNEKIEFNFPLIIANELLASFTDYLKISPFSYIDIPITIINKDQQSMRRIYQLRINSEDRIKIRDNLNKWLKGDYHF